MLKAGSLFYALVLTILMAILSSMLLLMSYHHRMEYDQLEQRILLQERLESGLKKILNSSGDFTGNELVTLPVFSDGEDSIGVIRKPWGIYTILAVRANFKNDTLSRVVIAGGRPDSTDRYALYLSDQSRPLALCGKTELKGLLYLPKAGIKTTFIEGQQFTGTPISSGQTKPSKEELPTIQPELLKQLTSPEGGGEQINKFGLPEEDTLYQSFWEPMLMYSSNSAMEFRKGNYSGHICFQSTTSITISSGCKLNDVMLKAPRIVLEEGVNGSFQAIASDSLVVEKDVKLSYPSCLVLCSEGKFLQSGIRLAAKDSIYGSILVINTAQNPLASSCVKVPREAFVYGEIISNSTADVQGTVYGSVSCSKLRLCNASSVYDNHLLNAVIDNTRLSNSFVGCNWQKERKHLSVLKIVE